MSAQILRRFGQRKTILMITVTLAAFSISGCGNRKPGGQTVAVVNGMPITESELNLELASVDPAVRKEFRDQALKNLVERKVLVSNAADEKMDQDSTFVLERQRTNETMLAQRYIESMVMGSRRPVTESDINDYLAKHPRVENGRQILSMSQLQFAAIKKPEVIKQIKDTQTLQQLVDVLNRNGIANKQGSAELDSTQIPEDVLQSLDKLAPGEPLVSTEGPQWIASVVIAREAAPLSGKAATDMARKLIETERATKVIKDRSKGMMSNAKIEYADGFLPKVQKASPAK